MIAFDWDYLLDNDLFQVPVEQLFFYLEAENQKSKFDILTWCF